MKIGDVIEIDDAPHEKYKYVGELYDFKNKKTACPICKGVGIPWMGWWTCCQGCGAIAVVSDGRTFVPYKSLFKRIKDGLLQLVTKEIRFR